MNNEDSAKFKELITLISETCEMDFSEAKIKSWWAIFKDYTISDFETGVYGYIRCPDEGMFKPKPSNIIKFITGTSKQNETEAKDRAEVAWLSVYEQIGRVGSYGTLKLDDKRAIAAVKAIGGWVDLTQRTYQELEWKKKAFFSAYDSFDRVPLEELPGNAPGLIAQDKAKKSEPKSLSSLSKGLDEYRKSQGLAPIGDILNATNKGE